MKIRINGKEYDWGTIKIIMWGRPVVGATSVDYKLAKAKEALYAAGRYAKGIQHGQRAASGTLTLLQSEIIAMNRAARERLQGHPRRGCGYSDLLHPRGQHGHHGRPDHLRLVFGTPSGMKAGT